MRGTSETCKALDISRKLQTVSFTVDWKDRTAYTSARAYLIDAKNKVYPKTTGMNLEELKSYGIKIDYNP
jgi:hypothetical protein